LGFLIDTCIWVAVERGALAPADVALFTGTEAVYISPVTIAELKFGAENTSDLSIRQKRQAALHRLKRKPILHIDETISPALNNHAEMKEKIPTYRFFRRIRKGGIAPDYFIDTALRRI